MNIDRESRFYKRQLQVLSLISPVILLILWQMATSEGWIRLSVLPAPSGVLETVISLWEKGILQKDFIASIQRILFGFITGSFCGIFVGILIGIFPRFDAFTSFLVAIFRPIPIIALIPFFILWFGIGEESKIAVIFLGSFWQLLISTIEGIKGIDRKLLELAKILKKSRLETIKDLIIPYDLPFIFTGIRLALCESLGYVITSEMIAASYGIGYRIMYARSLAQPGMMVVGIIEIGLIGVLCDYIMRKSEKKLFRYR